MTDSPPGPRRLYLVDDHPGVREGLRLLLEQRGYAICGEAGDAAQALEAIRGSAPDLVIVDLSLGDEGDFTLLRALARDLPAVPLLVYSMHEDPFRVRQALAAGASGYVTKRELSVHLMAGVEELLAGRRHTSPRAQAVLGAAAAAGGSEEPLSPRERLVYSLLGQGFGTPGIAETLGVSRRTVESYFARILAKLGVPGMEALRRRAVADRAKE